MNNHGNSNHNLIFGVITDPMFNTSYPYDFHSTPFSWAVFFVIFKVESGDLYEVACGNPEVDLDLFENYSIHILRPPDSQHILLFNLSYVCSLHNILNPMSYTPCNSYFGR